MSRFLSREQLEKLPTKRLLAYKRKRLHGYVPPCYERMEIEADIKPCDCDECKAFKEKLAVREIVKDILINREHVARGKVTEEDKRIFEKLKQMSFKAIREANK